MAKKKYNVAIVGATGAVGVEFILCLVKRRFPIAEIRLLASARSRGKKMSFGGKKVAVQELTEKSFEGIDIAFFSAGGSISRKFAPIAARAGAVVVDNSSAFRMDPAVPLIIPEINRNHPIFHFRQKVLEAWEFSIPVLRPPQSVFFNMA